MELTEHSGDLDRMFQVNGYVVIKKLIDRQLAAEAATWLRTQDIHQFKMTDSEPGNSFSRLLNGHTLEDTPFYTMSKENAIKEVASSLLGEDVHIWGSQVTLKAPWYGSVEYWHQDYPFYIARGYKKPTMLNCTIFLDSHDISNGGLHFFPGSHKEGLIEHIEIFDKAQKHKYTVPSETLDELYVKYGISAVEEGQPGDAVFFHCNLVHGSSHNISRNPRMTFNLMISSDSNKPVGGISELREFNLHRSKMELQEAEKRLNHFKQKHHGQLDSEAIGFNAPSLED